MRNVCLVLGLVRVPYASSPKAFTFYHFLDSYMILSFLMSTTLNSAILLLLFLRIKMTGPTRRNFAKGLSLRNGSNLLCYFPDIIQVK